MPKFRASSIRDALYALALLSVVSWNVWNLRLHLPLDSFCRKRHAALTERLEHLSPETRRTFDRSVVSLGARLDLADYLRDKRPVGNRASKLAAQRMMTLMEEDLQSLELGLDTVNARRGTVFKAHRSAVDGTAQPYWLELPPGYLGDKAFPLIINLHYHGWYRPFQGYPLPKVPEAIVVSPHGRGSTDFMFVGEREVLDVIEEVKRDCLVDDDRVSFMGSSMGGTGCWHLAVHYPDLFAAIAPVSGNTNHRVWEKEWGWGKAPESPFRPVRERLADMLDPISFAENLQHVPVFCAHGVKDPIVPLGHSRTMADQVRAAGGKVVYREYEDVAHGGFPKELADERIQWLLGQRRTAYPKQFRFRTASLRQGRAYWVEVLGFEHYGDFAEIAAEVVGPALVRVTTRNVARLALRLDADTRARLGLASECSVELDSTRLPLLSAGATQVLARTEQGWTTTSGSAEGAKRPGLSGPVEDAFLDPFLVVYGTAASSALENQTIRSEAELFASEWERRYGKPCRLKADREVTDADIQQSGLVLYGNESANSVLARIADKLPIRVTPAEVRFGARVFRGGDVGAKFCFPNPLNPDRYGVVFTATTWQGMFQINSRFGNWFDWGACDNRNWFDFAVFDDRTASPETFLQVGFFGDRWKLDSQTTWDGIPSLRETAIPRRVPTHREPPAAAQVYLSDLLPTDIDQPKGTAQFDRSFNGGQLHLADTPVARGLGVRVPSSVTFALGGRFVHFRSSVGIDYEGEKEISKTRRKTERLRFLVYGDGKLLASSPELNYRRPSYKMEVALASVEELTLTVKPESTYLWHFGSAAWADAQITAN
ncbi:MAG: prolyl oligopeptidase family serine peptidase [Armatimonadetes bacterium]|nr:prolyl oligopeptidase family serine peptidase [Armatimonadota bacterium]